MSIRARLNICFLEFRENYVFRKLSVSWISGNCLIFRVWGNCLILEQLELLGEERHMNDSHMEGIERIESRTKDCSEPKINIGNLSVA